MADHVSELMKKILPAILALAALIGHFYLTWGVVDWPTHLIFSGVILVFGWGGLMLVVGGLEQLPKSVGVALFISLCGLIMAYPGLIVPLYPGLSDDRLERLPFGSVTIRARAERLGWAIHYHDEETAKALLDLGIGDIRLRNRDGEPVLFGLASPDMIAVLADHGADPNARDGDGKTPLFHTRDPAVAQALLDAGADPNHKDVAGYSPLMLVRRSEEEDYARILIAAGGDLAMPDPAGKVAAQRLPSELQQKLVEDVSLLTMPVDASVYENNRQRGMSWITENITSGEPVAVIAAEGPLQYYQTGTLLIRIANTYSEELRLSVEADIGVAAMFVDASHGGRFEEPDEAGMDRTIVWDQLVLPPGGVGQLSLKLLARGSDSGLLTVSVRATDFRNDFDHYGSYSGELVSADGSGGGSLVGFLLFMLIPFSLIGFVVLKSKYPDSAFTDVFGRFAAAVGAFFTGAICLSTFTTEMKEWTEYVQTQCEVLDRRVFLSSSSSSDSGPTSVPQIGVRYATEAGEQISEGSVGSTEDLDRIALGAVIDCWYDPEYPDYFVVDAKLSIGWLIFSSIFGLIALGFGYLVVRPWNPKR